MVFIFTHDDNETAQPPGTPDHGHPLHAWDAPAARRSRSACRISRVTPACARSCACWNAKAISGTSKKGCATCICRWWRARKPSSRPSTRLVATFFDGSMKAAAAAFVDPSTANLSKEDLMDLERADSQGAVRRKRHADAADQSHACFSSAALIALARLRGRATAAMRHLLCVCALAGSLILPFAAAVPAEDHRCIRLLRSSAAIVRSQAIAQSAGLVSVRESLLALWAIGLRLLLLRLVGHRPLAHRAADPLRHARHSRDGFTWPMSVFRSPAVFSGRWC